MAWTTPKTDWETGELVAASDMNEIGENSGGVESSRRPQLEYTTERHYNVSLGNADFADVDSANMNLTITTTGGDVLVHVYTVSVILAGNTPAYFDLEVDGVPFGWQQMAFRETAQIIIALVRDYPFEHFSRLIQSLSAGSHTFKLQWRTNRGYTAHIEPAILHFWVREI